MPDCRDNSGSENHGRKLLIQPKLTRYESRHEKTNVLVLTWSGTNQAVYSYRRRLEILDLDSRENKGADQLSGYREADLCLCFRICKIFVFS